MNKFSVIIVILLLVVITAMYLTKSVKKNDSNIEVSKTETRVTTSISSDSLEVLLQVADNFMREEKPSAALKSYQEIWDLNKSKINEKQQIWLILSIANSAIRCEKYEEAFGALSALLEGYSKSGIIVGNPLYHLFVGLTYEGLNESPDLQTDNFARALICGGPEIFNSENPKYLKEMLQILRPPAELGTWEGYKGCSRDLLNGATGYLASMIEERIGEPLPYQYED